MLSHQHLAIAAEVYQKTHKAASLTDAEINTALEVLKPHQNLISLMGPAFKLYHQEIDQTIRRLEGFQRERKQK